MGGPPGAGGAPGTVAVVTSTVLAYIPSPSRGVWSVGPIPIRAYAVCIILGIIVAIWWGDRRWVARGGKPGTILDVAMFAVPFGLLGGRLYHVATDWRTYFGAGGDPWGAFKVWEGGLGIWGAVLLGGVGAWIGCRVFKIPLAPLGDALAPAILLAQAIGRLGNYFNQELYGRATNLPWGLKIYERYDPDTLQVDNLNGISTGQLDGIVHPTFLYEMLWNLVIVALLVWADRRFTLGHGRLFALYVAGYCLGRLGVELLRDDPATHLFGVRINVYTAVLVGLAALVYFLRAPRGREEPEELVPADERASDPEPTAEDKPAADVSTPADESAPADDSMPPESSQAAKSPE
ncbi:MAG: prolipoprotein diacylglyceryl transferase [Mycobacteriaceae bacterium]|nr:prolipoprotein diacylglyceryl transferase [Mycobacteriaceae bacterium]